MSHYAVMLAGGGGARLWPLSRSTYPKQFLSLNGNESLLQQTARRLLPKVHPSRMFTVTHSDHRFEALGQLYDVHPELAEQVLVEPMAHNTLPAIAWAVSRIRAADPEALVSVFPSDHAIRETQMFYDVWKAAEAAALERYIVLFGIAPTSAHTGYGYIEGVAPGWVCKGKQVQRVKRFVEKPDLQTASDYLAQGGYYWNSGMFVFRADVFLEELHAHAPQISNTMQVLAESRTNTAGRTIYEKLPVLSIDCGLIEKSSRVAVVPADMGWSDLGSWEALYQAQMTENGDNVTHGNVVALQSKNNLLWNTDSGILTAFGIDNLVVVNTRDATLVVSREQAANLKEIVDVLKTSHPLHVEAHNTVRRPWGSYTVLEETLCYKVKRIVVNPGSKLSLQLHHHRSEHWVVIAGTATVTRDTEQFELQAGESTYIPPDCKHRLENNTSAPLQIIEVQRGEYLGEDDILRFDDVYGRAVPACN